MRCNEVRRRVVPGRNQRLGPGGIQAGFIVGIPRVAVDDPGSANYRWLLLLDGGVRCRDEHDDERALVAGDCFVRAPHTPHRVTRSDPGSYLEFSLTLPIPYWRFLCQAGLIDEQQRFASLGMSSELVARCWRCFEHCGAASAPRQRAALLHEVESLLLSLHEGGRAAVDHETLQAVQCARERLDDLERACTIGVLAAELRLGEDSLRRAFQRVMGCNPKAYRIRRRIEGAIALLRDPDRSLASIASELGYADAFAFSKQFKQQTGISPSRYRAG